jgi:Mn2+/Fe2+ NRAMP family transporter
MRTDTYFGMRFSDLIAFFIILDSGAVLCAHSVRDIQSATQAAKASRPLAGKFAFLLFSIGILHSRYCVIRHTDRVCRALP